MDAKPTYILWFDECNARSISQVGSKVGNLGEMMRAGVQVPPGFAVTKDVYERVVLRTDVFDAIEGYLADCDPSDLSALADVGKTIRHRIRSAPLPADVEAAIRQAYEALAEGCGVPDVPVAVRSSATAEDLPGASFAGQQETYLWVCGADAVVQRVIDCWASLFTDRAISYRAKMGFPSIGLAISVGVQKMVNPKAAGVMFSVNPMTGNRSQVVIEGNWGLGESIVQGMIVPDRYIVDKGSLDILMEERGEKTERVVPAEGGATTETVPASLQGRMCLTHEEVRELATLARRVEEYYGEPQDIEWAVDLDVPFPQSISVLQTRPVTVAGVGADAARYEKEEEKDSTDHIIDLMIKGFRG